MAATPYPGYPTMRTRSPAERSASRGKPSRMAATPYPGYPSMRTVARLSAARAGETFPDSGYALSGLSKDANP
ncbi:hypothetical protein [Klebsiella quasivariicola]|uniref:hypothetical protein n=1 Tax=Klebsiella quasivariicola TaxID=2026240 RepID=UPI00247924D0|nr:hypothetical protein [Klebsiella quasivariicola]